MAKLLEFPVNRNFCSMFTVLSLRIRYILIPRSASISRLSKLFSCKLPRVDLSFWRYGLNVNIYRAYWYSFSWVIEPQVRHVKTQKFFQNVSRSDFADIHTSHLIQLSFRVIFTAEEIKQPDSQVRFRQNRKLKNLRKKLSLASRCKFPE